MGGSASSSARRDSRCGEDADAEAAEERAAGTSIGGEADDDKLLQKNGQISILNVKTRSHADEIKGPFEERVLADVGSGFVTLPEDGTEAVDELHNVDFLQPNSDDTDGTVKIGTEEDDASEVGFKKIFSFVGFKFTLKKDTCKETEGEANEPETNATLSPENTSGTQETSRNAVSSADSTQNQTDVNRDSTEANNLQVSSEKVSGKESDSSSDPKETMSPIKLFFTQGIFSSLKKKKKEDEIQKENLLDDPIDKTDVEKPEEVEKDSKCTCLDFANVLSEEEKIEEQKDEDKTVAEGEAQKLLDQDKMQGSPFKRLFRRFSTRRQTEGKTAEKESEAETHGHEQPESTLETAPLLEEEEPKPAAEEPVCDPSESKLKGDSAVWEALICGGSSKKRGRKTHEDENESPLGSSVEGEYDHLTSSNEQSDSPDETGSTWKSLRKMVTPKRKVRSGENTTPEQIPSDRETNKSESFSVKKLLPVHKKQKSEGRRDQSSSDEAAKDHETGNDEEDDDTPAIIPLSEYVVIEPESLQQIDGPQAEITIEPEIAVREQDKSTDSGLAKASPALTLSEEFEELTDFLSKHQQLSDIPEEGAIEESAETAAEWQTQEDTLAEDIVEWTADAITAPESLSEKNTGDDTTEMISALSQLSESAGTSGLVTPEHGHQMSDVVLQEAVQAVFLSTSAQAVTSEHEAPESLVVSVSPFVVESSTIEQRKVLVARNKSDATAICIGLSSQEIPAVEEPLPAVSVEAVREVKEVFSSAVAVELCAEREEVATLRVDELYKAGIVEVKTEFKEVFLTDEADPATETELNASIYEEQVVHTLARPLAEESFTSQVVRVKESRETDTSDAEISQVGLDMFYVSTTESVLPLVLTTSLGFSEVTAEKEQELPDADLSAGHLEQAALEELVQPVANDCVGWIHQTLESEASERSETRFEVFAPCVENLETKDAVCVVDPISDDLRETASELEEEDESVHADISVVQTHVKEVVLNRKLEDEAVEHVTREETCVENTEERITATEDHVLLNKEAEETQQKKEPEAESTEATDTSAADGDVGEVNQEAKPPVEGREEFTNSEVNSQDTVTEEDETKDADVANGQEVSEPQEASAEPNDASKTKSQEEEPGLSEPSVSHMTPSQDQKPIADISDALGTDKTAMEASEEAAQQLELETSMFKLTPSTEDPMQQIDSASAKSVHLDAGEEAEPLKPLKQLEETDDTTTAKSPEVPESSTTGTGLNPASDSVLVAERESHPEAKFNGQREDDQETKDTQSGSRPLEESLQVQVLDLYEAAVESPDATAPTTAEIQTQAATARTAATVEATEPMEEPQISEVEVATPVVTDLEVEVALVTAEVAELEAETSVPETTEAQKVVVGSVDQNIPVTEEVHQLPTCLEQGPPAIPEADNAAQVLAPDEESGVVASVAECPVFSSVMETQAPSEETSSTEIIAVNAPILTQQSRTSQVDEMSDAELLVEALAVSPVVEIPVEIPAVVSLTEDVPELSIPEEGAPAEAAEAAKTTGPTSEDKASSASQPLDSEMEDAAAPVEMPPSTAELSREVDKSFPKQSPDSALVSEAPPQVSVSHSTAETEEPLITSEVQTSAVNEVNTEASTATETPPLTAPASHTVQTTLTPPVDPGEDHLTEETPRSGAETEPVLTSVTETIIVHSVRTEVAACLHAEVIVIDETDSIAVLMDEEPEMFFNATDDDEALPARDTIATFSALAEEEVSEVEMAKASLELDSSVEPSEVEEDVWEDAVDSIGHVGSVEDPHADAEPHTPDPDDGC